MTRPIPSTEPPFTAHRTLKGAVIVLKRLARLLTYDQAAVVALAIAIAVAILAPLGPLAANRFHRDEAIYSSWSLDIASGRDLLVSGSPVDKPPLFLYVQSLSFLLFGPTEVAARVPSLVASVASVVIVYVLGRSLYGQGTGLLAAFLLAASPFTILFAPTAFTDPVMVAFVLAGCLAAVRRRWGLTGIAMGLAAITKQQGAFFVPLALGLGLISNQLIPDTQSTQRQSTGASVGRRIIKLQVSSLRSPVMSFIVTFLAVLGLALGWDVARAREPGFLAQSLVSYGGLSLAPPAVWERFLGFWDLLRYGTGSPVLNGVLLAGGTLLLMVDMVVLLARSNTPSSELNRPDRPGQLVGKVSLGTESPARADLVLVAFILLFLVAHSAVAFQVWDRYLLGLIPFVALFLARVLTLPWRLLKKSPVSGLLSILFVLWMLTFTFRPIRDAAASRFPIGGDHSAYQGIEQVVNYFRTIPADTTLYHRWLGWHWRFYLWGSPYDFYAWTSPADLAAHAVAHPGPRHYIVFPSWRSSTEVRLALADVGLSLREVHRTFRNDGSVSFVVFRIERAQ